MKPKSQKKEELKKLKAKLPKSKITVFTTFSRAGEKGLSVAQMSELKKALRAMDAEYFVTKKTLMDLVLKESKDENVDVYNMDGSVGLVLGSGDAYAISKKLYEFAKKNKALQFFGAIFESHFIDKDGFLEMAMMPSREVLLARLFGMMKYPISGLAIVLSEVAKKREVGA
jgi:large subunit ribosomal protein L10